MTVVLVVMARDEEQVIARCIESARPLVDAVVVVDTGSTDGTIDVARSCGAVVHERPWVDFSSNRNEALDLARPHGDWILFLDADMTVAGSLPDLDPAVDAYDVTIRESVTYRLPLLTRSDADVRYEGRTHECLVGIGSRGYADGLTVTHHADGGTRGEKYARDLKLLDGLDDPRSVYYRAISLRGLGRWDEAAAAFLARSQMGGWEDERWHAWLCHGDCLRTLGRLHEAQSVYVSAHCQDPTRPEPLRRLAAMWPGTLFAREMTDLAVQAVPRPDALFVEP